MLRKSHFGSDRPPLLSALVWIGGFRAVIICLGVLAGLLVVGAPDGRCASQKKEEKKRAYEVRQGGYVEKMDPNVDYKDQMPRIAPMEPEQSIKNFRLVPGLRIEQVATEPLVADVVDMAFDENGRMYVAELITYAEFYDENGRMYAGELTTHAELQQKGGVVTNTSRVSLLEDKDGDGKFDTSTVFAEGLSWPAGLTCFDGGLFVATMPEVIYLKDTNGDDKADVRKVVLSGFSTSNPVMCPNSLRWGLDNRVHGMGSGAKLLAVMWENGAAGRKAEPVSAGGRDFSLDPRSGELRLESGGSQFGMGLDEWGRKFESSNIVPIEMVMYEDRYVGRNPYLAAPSARLRIHADSGAVYRTSRVEPWRILRTELRKKGTFSGPVEGGGTPAGYFTGACGVYVYKGTALPEEFRGNAFVAEGSGNLVHRMRLDPSGVAFTAHRTEKAHEFLTSDEIWFRPIQFTDGPDGALYMADFYREIYELPDAIPASARKYLDLLAGSNRGRVYRFVPQGFKQPAPVRLGQMSTVELVGLLAHPNGWHRNTASRLLYERQDRKAVLPLAEMTARPTSPLGRMHAMYALDGLGMLTPEIVLPRLGDEHPRVREHAVRLAEVVLADSPAVRSKLYTMVDDPDIRVRYQLAFTLGEILSDQATAALAAVAKSDVGDKWIRLALLSSCFGRAGDLFAKLAADAQWRATKNGRGFLSQLAEQAGLQKRDDQVAEVFNAMNGLPDNEKTLLKAVAAGLGKGLEKSNSPLRERLTAGGKVGQALAQMVTEARAHAADGKLPVDKRVAAVRSLGLASSDVAQEILADLLDSRQPGQVQVAAIQAMSRFQADWVAEAIVESWGGFTPKVRAEAAEALFARTERLFALLEAVENEAIGPSQLDPARVQFLLSHSDEKIRRSAKKLLGGVELARREEVIQSYHDVLALKGDPALGKEVFKAECATCHLLEGVGYDLGLPLNAIQNKGPEAILQAVLDPNRDVLPQYLNYVVVTDDGLSVTGMIDSETATSINLKRAEGESDTVLRTNIDEMVNTGISIMPEGLEEQVDKKEMADLIAYLMSLL